MVSDLKTFALKSYKIAAQKKFVFGRILPYWAGFFWYRCFSLHLTVFFHFPKSTVMEEVVSDLKTFAHKGCKIDAVKKVFYDFFHLFTPFKHLFAPTSQSPMSKLFRFLESLREKWLKEVVSDLKTFACKGYKIAAPKQFFFFFFFLLSANFALLAGFFWYQCYYSHRSRDALSPVCGIFLFSLVIFQ